MLMSNVFAILDSVEIPMRDGTVLRGDIWLPGGEGQWPVLLHRTPYGKEDAMGVQVVAGLDFRAALRRGYAIVVQDIRGRFASDGLFEPFGAEQEDGADTVRWLREQKFCNGQVAMFGASYPGAAQVLAATQAAPGLVAIAPQLTTGRHGETWMYRSGALELGFLTLWIMEALAPNDLPRRLPVMGEEQAKAAREVLAAMHKDVAKAFDRLPILDQPLEALAPYARGWFDNAQAAIAQDDPGALNAIVRTRTPMLVIAGWNDIFLEGSIELFQAAHSRWTTEPPPDRLIIGPWSHGNMSAWQGDTWTGYGGQAGGISEEQLGFFDAAIGKSEGPSSAPLVRYFRSGSNTWHTARQWPVPSTAQPFFLHAETRLIASAAPKSFGMLSYLSNTLDPVATTGGATLLPGAGLGKNSGPRNQASIESRPDLLVFTSPALAEDLDVTGLVEAWLWVSSSAPECDWTVKLCEVDADGHSIGRVDGILRWQNSANAGGPIEVKVTLGHLSHLFSRGSRIRVQIASSNFPRFDRNPQSGIPSCRATRADFAPATQQLHCGPKQATRIVLPVVPVPDFKAAADGLNGSGF